MCYETIFYKTRVNRTALYRVRVAFRSMSSQFQFDKNIYIDVGASRLNPNYLPLIFFVKLGNSIIAALFLLYFLHNNKIVPYNLKVSEQSCLVLLGFLNILKSEFLSVWSHKTSNIYGRATLYLNSAFYAYMIYFWMVFTSRANNENTEIKTKQDKIWKRVLLVVSFD